MKIKCPRCKSQLEVDAIGDFVSCFHCSLEFTVDEPKVEEPTMDEPVVLADEPKPRRSFGSILSNINWLRLAFGGISISLIILLLGLSVFIWFLYRHDLIQGLNPEIIQNLKVVIGNVGFAIIGLVLIAFILLLFVNILLWIFLPLMVYSIKKSLEEAVCELKNLKNI